jgi:hypothetical protein
VGVYKIESTKFTNPIQKQSKQQEETPNMTSLCIPRIEASITKDYIFNVFSKLKIGYIEKIIEIPLKNDPKHKRIIIKIIWSEINPKSIEIQNRLTNQETIKVVHNMPWYWKIVAANPQK